MLILGGGMRHESMLNVDHEIIIHPSNDIEAILEAAVDGDSFFLEPGLHTASGLITIANKKNISIRGTAGARVTRSGSPQLFQITGCEDFCMEGFTITVATANLSVLQINDAGAGPYQYPTRHSYVGLHFEITSGAGAVDGCIVCVDSFIQGVIRDCTMDGPIESAIVIYAGASENAEATIISNNRILATIGGGQGINVGNQGNAGMIVEDNQVIGPFYTGIDVGQLSLAMSIRGNIIRGVVGGYGILTGSGCDRAVISHNIIYDSGADGMELMSDYSVIEGNQIYSPGGKGLIIKGIRNQVSGNNIDSATLEGIRLEGDYNNISSNTVTAGSTSAINIISGADYNSISGNKFSGNATGPILNGGVDNKIDGKVENRVSTIDAAVTTVTTVPMPDDATSVLEVTITAFRTNGADQAVYKNVSLVSRRAGGNCIIEGSGAVSSPIESDTNWVITFVVSTTSILVQVQGFAAKSINWKCRHTVESVV